MLYRPLTQKILSALVQRRFCFFSLSNIEVLCAVSLILPLVLADFFLLFRSCQPLLLFDSARLFFHRLSLSELTLFSQFFDRLWTKR